MKRGFLSIIMSFVCTILFAQVPPIVWQKSLGGSLADEGRSVLPTSDGGYIVGGTSSSNDGNVSGNHGGTDCWVVKLSATGVIEWQQTYGGTGNETFGSIRVTADGGYIMAATTTSDNGDVSGNHGGADAWVVKLTSTGVISWQKCFGSTGPDYLYYVEETADGGYIALGLCGYGDGDLAGQMPELYGGWIFKLTVSRTIEWQIARFDSGGIGGGIVFTSIRQISDGGFVYGGFSRGITGDAFVGKLNSAGTYVAGESLPIQTPGAYEGVAPSSVVPTDDGGCAIVYKNDGATGAWLAPVIKKYTSAMVPVWTSILDACLGGNASHISKTSDNGFLLTGNGSSGGFFGLQGGADYWVAKISNTGLLQWQRALGSAGNDYGYRGEQAGDGSYILVGSGAANSGYITGNHGGNDFWVAKLSSSTSGFTITSSAGVNGAINPEGATAVNPNANQSYTITPNANYRIANVLVNGVSNAGAISSGTYTFTNVTADNNISATFVLNNAFLITSSAGANGTISPNGSTTVFSGNSQTYTITPSTGYRIANVLVDGVSNAGAISSGTYTFTNVTAAHTISATFTVATYTITASSSTGGSVNPGGATQVNYGGSQYYTFSRSSGYDLTDVLVDGISVGPVASYNFSNVTANHTISATFTALQAAPPVQWQKSLGGTADDFATSVQPTSDGGFIVGGTSSSNDGNVTGNHGGTDYWVTKLNSSGGVVWQQSFGGSGSDALSSIRVTSDGGYIVSGTTNSGNGDVNDNHAAGVNDGWVIKLSSTGTIEWKKCYGGTGIDYLNYIEQTADGGYIAVGNSPGGDGNTSGSLAGGGAWLMKLNSTGAVQWQSNYATDAMTGRYAGTVTQTSDGGYILGTTTTGISKIYTLIKFNASGNVQWEWYPNNELSDIYTPKSVKQTSDGGYIFVAPGYYGKFLAIKLSSTGTTQWRKEIGGTNFEIPGNGIITSDGGYLLTGYTYSNDGYVTGNHGAAATGDYWVVKMNSAGTVQWQKALGGTGNDEGYWGEQTSDGYILAGKGSATSGYITGNHGGNDFWVVKLSNTTGFTLTASAGVNGTITPEGSTPITAGGNQSYTISPNANYRIANVLVDGVSNTGAINTGTYTFSNVNTDHTISASFILINSFPITASTGANGTISPNGTTNVLSGTNQTYTFTPNANYRIANVLVDGVSNSGAVSSGTYTFTNVTAPHTISVTFTINTNTITATAGAGGTISPAGAVQVPYTSGQGFSFTPNSGFTISNVLVDGVSVGTPSSYSFFNVTAPHTISVSFAALLPSPNIIWQRSLGGTGAEEALSIQPTNDGGFIVGGTSNSNNGNVSGNHGGTDYWVAKLNPYGTIEWQRSLGGSGNETFKAVRKTNDGGYIVVGYTNSNNGDVSGNHGNNDAWIVKLSSTGTTQWQRCHGNISNDFLSYIEQTSDGGYISVGQGASFDGNQSGFEGGASWIVKMDNNGIIEWQKSTPLLAFGAGNYVSYIHQTSDGGYIATGHSTYGGSPGTPDIFIWKLDNAGTSAQYLNLGQYVSASPGTPYVIQSNDGGYVLCYPSYATNGYGVMKLSSSFSVQWTKNLSGDFGIPGNIVQAQDGGYLITGTGFVFNPGPTANHGGNDILTVKLTANGVLEWQKSMGGTGNESGYWGDVLTPGNYIAAGSSTTNNGDVTGTHGSTDFWVVKYGIGDTVITSSAGANGTISPLGNTRVSLGGNQTFTITPNPNYYILDVLVDGVSNAGAISSGTYTFSNVTTAHSISATFASSGFNTITSSAGTNGSISPNGSTLIAFGGSQTYTIVPNSGYSIANVLVDGVSNAGAISSGTYTFTNVTAPHTISATFAIKTYTITASAGTGGNVSPNGATQVNHGASQPYAITANIGFVIADVIVDGSSVGAVSSYTFTNVTAPHTISVTFTALPGNVFVSGALTGNGGYFNLEAAITAIGTSQLNANIVVDITGNTTEVNSVAIGVGSWASLTIRPSGGSRAITGAISGAPLINLNGADRVAINGLNSGGNTLTISNTSTSNAASTSTIRFINGATNNTVTNCTVLGSSTLSTVAGGGTIFFATDALTSNGNDNNTISNCKIGPAGANLPTTGIGCIGTASAFNAGIANSGNVINNNEIYDWFNNFSSCGGIYGGEGCTGWVITNNKFYQTASRAFGAVVSGNTAISISNTTAVSGAQGFTISGNIIGYASAAQTGVSTYTGSQAVFRGITFNGMTGGTVSTISNNTIAAISLTGATNAGTGSSAPFAGINVMNGSAIVNNNFIGSQSATGSIVYSTNSTGAIDIHGIYYGGSNNFQSDGNSIGGISATNTAAGNIVVYLMRSNTPVATSWSASSNTIGGTVANSVFLNNVAALSQVIGMQSSNASAIFTANTIRNLTVNYGIGTGNSASVIGISQTSASSTNTISQNIIYNLSNTLTYAASIVTGIHYTAGSGSNLVERNFIYAVNTGSNIAGSELNGIRVNGGTTTFRNNMLSIGAPTTRSFGTGTNTGTSALNGILETGGTNNFYHNSIYISGTASMANPGVSFAFNSTVTNNTRAIRNNIFYNGRTNTLATAKHYAIKLNGTAPNPAGLTINNNIYFSNGTGAAFGFYNGADVASLAAWKIAVGQDAASFESNPQYNNAGATPPDLHIHAANATNAEGSGADIGATLDYDGQTRSLLTPTDIGADAGNFVPTCIPGTWTGLVNNDWNNAANWSCNTLPSPASTIIINTGTPHLNQNFTVAGSLTVGGSASLIIDPAYTLTISGTADFGGRPVTFKSAVSGTASLGQVNGILSGATNVTVERYIPNNGFRAWRLLSVPTYGSGQTIRQAWQEGDVNPLPLQNNLLNYGTQITGVFTTQAAAAAAGFDSTSVQAAMLSWNGTGWSNVTTTNQPVASQKSWFLFIRGERSQGVTGSVNNSTATTLRTRGTVYVGDQITNVGANAFALVPNLYPSAINFTGLSRTGGVNNMFYIWDSKKMNGSSLGAYQTFSATNGFIPMVNGGSYAPGQPNTTIESGQSFFVTSTAGGTITLKESAKISGTNGSLGLRPVVKAKIDTRLYNSLDEMLDATAIVFDAAYDKAIADEDAPKLGNPGANFAIEKNSKLLAIEGTKPVRDGDAIQFRMWNLAQGAYSLELAASNMVLADGVTATLEDSYLKTTTPISLSESTKVKFEINSNAGSSAANRFKIVFSKAKPAINNGKQLFTVAPSLIESGVMNVQFSNQAAGRYSIRLLATGGQSVMVKAVSHAGGNATQNISLPSGLASGTYTVEIVAPNKTRSTQTVVVNRR